MKLISISQFFNHLIAVIKRFPFEFTYSIVAPIAWCSALYFDNYGISIDLSEDLVSRFYTVLVICNFGLTTSFGFSLWAEKVKLNIPKKWLINASVLIICVLLFWLLNPVLVRVNAFRMIFLCLASHFFVAFVPYLKKGETNGFWQYNKTLFIRGLTTFLYSAVLFIGLAIALASVKGLFGISLKETAYFYMFAIISAGFSPIFFLAGIPNDLAALDKETAYPKGLKIFTQFVLIPLMSIYLLILLVYEVKIIIDWQLPKGLVSKLIIGYAVFGILSLLLVYPLRDNNEHKWIKLFSKFFYFMLIPLVILLLLAVWKRIGPYGITEERYILLILALWLSGITVYFLISKKQNIKVIPLSLAFLALIAVYGPQSASGLSKISQTKRFNKLLNSTKKGDLIEKASIISYLVRNHGLYSLQAFTQIDLKALHQEIKAKNKNYLYVEILELDTAKSIFKVKKISELMQNDYFSFTAKHEGIVMVSGFDYIMDINYSRAASIDGKLIDIDFDDQEKLLINLNKKPLFIIDLRILFDDYLAQSRAAKLSTTNNPNTFIIDAKPIATKTVGNLTFTYFLKTLSGTANKQNDEVYNNIHAEGYLLIKKNKN